MACFRYEEAKRRLQQARIMTKRLNYRVGSGCIATVVSNRRVVVVAPVFHSSVVLTVVVVTVVVVVVI
jgi:hypothetical protein